MKQGETDPALETEWGSLEVVGRGGGLVLLGVLGPPPTALDVTMEPKQANRWLPEVFHHGNQIRTGG